MVKRTCSSGVVLTDFETPDQTDHEITEDRSDSRELPDKLVDNILPAWLEQEVDRKVNTLIGEEDYLGRCHIYWAAKKTILRNEYGLDWESPADEFPGLLFD